MVIVVVFDFSTPFGAVALSACAALFAEGLRLPEDCCADGGGAQQLDDKARPLRYGDSAVRGQRVDGVNMPSALLVSSSWSGGEVVT